MPWGRWCPASCRRSPQACAQGGLRQQAAKSPASSLLVKWPISSLQSHRGLMALQSCSNFSPVFPRLLCSFGKKNTFCPHFPLRSSSRAPAALAVTGGQDFTPLMSCSALSLLFITTTSSTAAGVLCSATKPYLHSLFPAAGPGMLENSLQRLFVTFVAK